MRWSSIALVALIGCGDTFHDPVELMAARAPADAIDCGHPLGGHRAQAEQAHTCVVDAIAAARPFRVLIDQAVADGRLAIGWVGRGDGSGEQ